MAKVAANSTNISVNSVALEDDIDNYTLNVTTETPTTMGLSTVGPTRVLGNYDYSLDVSGAADFAASQSDATLFALITDTSGVAMAVDPTGNAAGANDPNYDATSVMASSYSISGAVGGRVDFSCTLVGNSALSRAVA